MISVLISVLVIRQILMPWCCLADVNVVVDLLTFKSSRNCDNWPTAACDPYFRICAEDADTKCSGWKKTNSKDNKRSMDIHNEGISPNPNTFQIGNWLPSLTVAIEVWDHNTFKEDDRIADLRWSYNGYPNTTLRVTLQNDKESVVVSVMLSCGDCYSGSNCTVHCQPAQNANSTAPPANVTITDQTILRAVYPLHCKSQDKCHLQLTVVCFRVQTSSPTTSSAVHNVSSVTSSTTSSTGPSMTSSAPTAPPVTSSTSSSSLVSHRCLDSDTNCAGLKAYGICEVTNRAAILCAKTCNLCSGPCVDKDAYCSILDRWYGVCRDPARAKLLCANTCNQCGSTAGKIDPPPIGR